MDKKNVLVTGATGFLGSYILGYLIREGYENIYAIKRKTSSMDLVEEVKEQVRWIDCDIMDFVELDQILRNVDYIIHSAAIVSFANGEAEQMMKVNVKATAHLLDLATTHHIKKFIQISSISALGREKNGQTLDESNKWVKSKFVTNYAISKHLSEMECFRASAEGLNMAILNPSLILGAGLWKSGSTNIIKKVHEGLSFYTEGGTGIVDVRDVAILAVKLLESDIEGERIIANGTNINFKELIGAISGVFGKKIPGRKLGPFLREIAWRIEYLKSIIKNDSPIITKETIRQSSATFYFSNEKSKRLLSHDYIPWQKTIEESAMAYEHYLKTGEYKILNFDGQT